MEPLKKDNEVSVLQSGIERLIKGRRYYYGKKVEQLWLVDLIRAFLVIAVAITLGETWLPTSVLAELPPEMSQQIETLKKSKKRWLEVDLSEQQLTAWQGENPQYRTIVSTGKPATPTLSGIFAISRKLSQDRMRGVDYDVPNVPDVMYYHRGYAIHGAYWHNQFGTPVSHGCINLPLEAAQTLFEWTPVGTTVVIHE